MHALVILAVLEAIYSSARASAPSAGDCGPTSIPNVPGCWGTEGCAYIIAADLGPGAACKFDYCNCGDTNVMLLPETRSGTITIGCASWTTQPTAKNCPTAKPVLPTGQSKFAPASTGPTPAPGDGPTSSQPGQLPPPPPAPSAKPPSNQVLSGPVSNAVLSSSQSSVSDAFAIATQSETIIVAGGTTLHYSKETIQSLKTLTAPTTITATRTETNKDGSKFTIPAAIIIVGPGGSWWNGGTGGFGVHGPSCIWPFCPPGGGGNEGGGGSGKDPKDQNTPGSDEQPNDNKLTSDKSVSRTKTSQGTSAASSAITTESLSSVSKSSISSSSASSAAATQCSPSCPACGGSKKSKQDLGKRTPTVPRMRSLEKRWLPEPGNFGGNVAAFFRDQYNIAEKLNIQVTQQNGDGASAAISRPLGRQRYNAAVGGMYGCTSVFVASNAGVWISHFWELHSFRLIPGLPPRPRTQADRDRFTRDVLNQLRDGGIYVPGLRQYTGQHGQFGQAQRPVWAIFTPSDGSGSPNQYRYNEEIDEIRGLLNTLFPAAPDNIIAYDPRADEESQQDTPSGKLVFQYDPFQKIVSNSNNPCVVYQQAMFRVWMEDRPMYIWQKYWFADENQMITDFGLPGPPPAPGGARRKRENGPACKLPASVDVSYASSLPNMTPQDIPDPPAGTPYITLNPSGAAPASGASDQPPSQPSSIPSTFKTTVLSGSKSIANPSVAPVPPSFTPAKPSSTPPPKPTVKPIQCATKEKSYGDCWHDIHSGDVKDCASAMSAQWSWGTNVNAKTPNITQVYNGDGNALMMNIGWIPGCTTYKSMCPDNPLGKSGDGSISYTTLIKDTYHNCTGNSGLGGYLDVGCLRYGFYPNSVKGVSASPPHPENFWKQYPNICS